MVEELPEKPLLFIVSGPAGSGKTTLCDRMLETLSPRVQRVITATTRAPREGEVHGVDYYFMNEDAYKKNIERGAFYEYAKVHDWYYGTLKDEIHGKFQQGSDLLLNIDVQGAETLRKVGNDSTLKGRMVSIFIMPKNLDELKERLVNRGDSNEDIQSRMRSAQEEVKEWDAFDYCIPSSTKEDDFACLLSIYASEKLRVR